MENRFARRLFGPRNFERLMCKFLVGAGNMRYLVGVHPRYMQPFTKMYLERKASMINENFQNDKDTRHDLKLSKELEEK